MSENFGLDRKTGFQNTFYAKCINAIIDSIGPSIILRSIYMKVMLNFVIYLCTSSISFDLLIFLVCLLSLRNMLG